MTIQRISIEWRPISGTSGHAGHLYLVAREAGETNGQGKAISVGPSNPADFTDPFGGAYTVGTGDYGYVEFNNSNGAGSNLSQTIDAYGTGDTEDTRGSRDIGSQLLASYGGSLDSIWLQLTQLANEIDAAEFVYDPTSGLLPVGVGLNSNSAITTMLSKMGANVSDLRPYNPGTQTPTNKAFPGDDTLLSGEGDDYLRGWGNDDEFYDKGGSDIFHGGDGNNLVVADLTDGEDIFNYGGGWWAVQGSNL